MTSQKNIKDIYKAYEGVSALEILQARTSIQTILTIDATEGRLPRSQKDNRRDALLTLEGIGKKWILRQAYSPPARGVQTDRVDSAIPNACLKLARRLRDALKDTDKDEIAKLGQELYTALIKTVYTTVPELDVTPFNRKETWAPKREIDPIAKVEDMMGYWKQVLTETDGNLEEPPEEAFADRKIAVEDMDEDELDGTDTVSGPEDENHFRLEDSVGPDVQICRDIDALELGTEYDEPALEATRSVKSEGGENSEHLED